MLPIHAAIEAFALASPMGIDFERDGAKETVVAIYDHARPVIWDHGMVCYMLALITISIYTIIATIVIVRSCTGLIRNGNK